MVYQRINQFAALQCTARNFTKKGVHIRPFWQSVEKFWYIYEKNLLFSKAAGLYLCNFNENGFHHRDFPVSVLQGSSF